MIKKIFSDLLKGENVDLIIVILLGSSFFIINFFYLIPTKFIVPVNAVSISLFAYAILSNRYKTEELSKLILETGKKQFFDEFPQQINEYMKSSKNIILFGNKVPEYIEKYGNIIRERAKDGTKIFCLLPEPNNSALKYYSLQSSLEHDVTFFQYRYDKSLNWLKELRNLPQSKIEIRTIDFVFPYGIIGVDYKGNSGLLYVEFNTLGYESNYQPKCVFKSLDPWSDYFLKDLKSLWTKAVII